MSASNGFPAAHASLSDDEARLAALLAKGSSTDTIARELRLTKAEVNRKLDELGQKLRTA